MQTQTHTRTNTRRLIHFKPWPCRGRCVDVTRYALERRRRAAGSEAVALEAARLRNLAYGQPHAAAAVRLQASARRRLAKGLMAARVKEVDDEFAAMATGRRQKQGSSGGGHGDGDGGGAANLFSGFSFDGVKRSSAGGSQGGGCPPAYQRPSERGSDMPDYSLFSFGSGSNLGLLSFSSPSTGGQSITAKIAAMGTRERSAGAATSRVSAAAGPVSKYESAASPEQHRPSSLPGRSTKKSSSSKKSRPPPPPPPPSTTRRNASVELDFTDCCVPIFSPATQHGSDSDLGASVDRKPERSNTC